MKTLPKIVLVATPLIFIFAMMTMLIDTERVQASDDPFVGDAQCADFSGTVVDDLTGIAANDLCKVGSIGNNRPQQTETGWSWACYDTAGHLYNPQGEIDVQCNVIKRVVEIPNEQEEEETPEEIVEEIVETVPEVEEVAIVSEPKPIVRAIPTPVISTPVISVPVVEEKSSKKSKKRNKHEWFEHECQIDRDAATWDYSERSVNEIKTRCRAEVAACPIRSQR